MNKRQKNRKPAKENSKRSNSNPSTNISKNENGRYSSYTSRYLDMYLTKSIKENNITVEDKTNMPTDLIVNISKIKEDQSKEDNPWVNGNTSNHSFETEELISLMNKTTQSKSKARSKVKGKGNKETEGMSDLKANRYNTNNECLETFEIEENDIFINNSSHSNANANSKAIAMINDNKRNQRKNESKIVQIVITYEYDNNKWKLIKEIDTNRTYSNMNSNTFNNKCHTYYWICQEDYLSNCRIIPNNSIQSLNDIENSNKKLEKANEAYTLRNQSLETKLDQYRSLIKKQINEIAELSNIVRLLNEDKSKLNAEMKHYQNANSELSTLTLRLQSEVDILKNKNMILSSEVKKIPHLINEEMKTYKDTMKEKIGAKVQLLQQQNCQLKQRLNNKTVFAIMKQCEMQFIHSQIKIKEVSANYNIEKQKMKSKFENKIKLLEAEINQYKEQIVNLSNVTISHQSVNWNKVGFDVSAWHFGILADDLFSFTHDFQNEIASLQDSLLVKDEENKELNKRIKVIHEAIIKTGFFENEDESVNRIKTLLLMP